MRKDSIYFHDRAAKLLWLCGKSELITLSTYKKYILLVFVRDKISLLHKYNCSFFRYLSIVDLKGEFTLSLLSYLTTSCFACGCFIALRDILCNNADVIFQLAQPIYKLKFYWDPWEHGVVLKLWVSARSLHIQE